MNTMAIVSELADSGILAVGSSLTELPHWEPLVNDEDAHVEAMEAYWRDTCFCCCCTGECRQQSEDEYYDDPLMSGFVEGDYEAA